MKKLALVFILAVFVPSLGLAWLAVRSLHDQQFVLERQQFLLYQSLADSLSEQIGIQLAERQREFREQVETLLAGTEPRLAAPGFDERLRPHWPLAEIGFAVTTSGRLVSPLPHSSPQAQVFCAANSGFLGNLESAEVYFNVDRGQGKQTAAGTGLVSGNLLPSQNTLRKITPQQQFPPGISDENANVSKVVSTQGEFQQLIGDASDGMLARFIENKLRVLFWHRLERDSNFVFGAQLDLPRLVDSLRELIQVDPALREAVCVALLDDNARPVALSHAGFTANWKRPFAAAELGEALPHWELAVYLLHPDQLHRAAHTARWSIGLLVAVLVVAIGTGSWLITTDVSRQLRLTRQKTDFVSNVSHELKTPLTSIRMFSELLADGRVVDAEKQRSYLQIIATESHRLARLINNVLDFARLERGEQKYTFRSLNLCELLTKTLDTYRPQLESNGFKVEFTPTNIPIQVQGDPDALAQVLVNLLSNAEKYSDTQKEITVRARRGAKPPAQVEVCVLDRGTGVPRGCEEKIFEQFYRAHDSLGSGIQGSGLGLTLARQIARAHGGDVVYEPREGGGSCFVMRLPYANA